MVLFLDHEKVVLLQEMQVSRTSNYLYSTKCSASRVGRVSLREKLAIVPTPSSRVLALRCYLGGEARHKTDSSNSMQRARRTSNLKVPCRTLAVVVRDTWEEMMETQHR